MTALILQTAASFHFLPLIVLILGMGRNWVGNMMKAFQCEGHDLKLRWEGIGVGSECFLSLWEGFFVLGLKR
jgi:hypothetical protein